MCIRDRIQLKKYALIDDVFTDLVRDANGRATMKLMYNGKELHVSLGPKFKTVLAWSTPLPSGGGVDHASTVLNFGPRLTWSSFPLYISFIVARPFASRTRSVN